MNKVDPSEIELMFDFAGVTPQQQRILDIVALIVASGIILWQTVEEIIHEFFPSRNIKLLVN